MTRMPSIDRHPAAYLGAVLLFVWVACSVLDWAMPVPTGRRPAPIAAHAAPPIVAVRSDAPAHDALKSLPTRPAAAPNIPAADPAHDEHDWLMSHSEAVCVALVVWAEARGEALEGKIAVADLVINRLERHASSPCEVTREPSQFAIGGQGGIVRPTSADVAWRWCLFAAVSALRDREGAAAPRTHADATNGARCMLSPANMPGDARTWPAWAHGQPLAVIGGHAFFPCDY
jgi:hypothetical protein